jgi:hypothetical protein
MRISPTQNVQIVEYVTEVQEYANVHMASREKLVRGQVVLPLCPVSRARGTADALQCVRQDCRQMVCFIVHGMQILSLAASVIADGRDQSVTHLSVPWVRTRFTEVHTKFKC